MACWSNSISKCGALSWFTGAGYNWFSLGPVWPTTVQIDQCHAKTGSNGPHSHHMLPGFMMNRRPLPLNSSPLLLMNIPYPSADWPAWSMHGFVMMWVRLSLAVCGKESPFCSTGMPTWFLRWNTATVHLETLEQHSFLNNSTITHRRPPKIENSTINLYEMAERSFWQIPSDPHKKLPYTALFSRNMTLKHSGR